MTYTISSDVSSKGLNSSTPIDRTSPAFSVITCPDDEAELIALGKKLLSTLPSTRRKIHFTGLP